MAAEAFLQILIENITSFLEGELSLLVDFDNELENLSSRFSTIQAVLEDAQKKQHKDKAIENWLQKLNAAAYKVDDILDECKYEAARLKQSRLGRCHPEIITFRHKIGKKMKEMMEKLDAIAKERMDFHLQEETTERQTARQETGLVKKEGEEQFPVLEEMTICWCPMFVFPTLSSLKGLEFYGDKTDATGFTSISNLSALTSLNISYNDEATSIPEETFKSLANLKYLRISFFQKLKELPSSLASLNALKCLDIDNCEALESLPEEGVKGLTSIHLRSYLLGIVRC